MSAELCGECRMGLGTHRTADPQCDFHEPPAAADQPTTEPSTAAQALAQAVRESVAENTKGTSGPPNLATSYWEGYRDAGRELADLLDEPGLLERYPALGTPLALAPQPAADTEREVQWGVRDDDTGEIKDKTDEYSARVHVEYTGDTVMKHYVTRTHWEEA